MKPRVWDTLIYSGEADILECRLTELDPVLHRMVIAEGPLTFR